MFNQREYVLLELCDGAHKKVRVHRTANNYWYAAPHAHDTYRILLPGGKIKSQHELGNYVASWEPLTKEISAYWARQALQEADGE